MKRLPILLAIFVICVFASQAFATAQYPDKIYFDGKLYDLQSNPMEPYFEKNPDKKPKSGIVSSALWRGYVATFEVADGGLYLRDVEIKVRDPQKEHSIIFKSVIDEVLPKGQKLKIDWFSGLLILPYGKMVNYVHMGYGSTFENYILVEINSGDFKQSKSFDFNSYEAFKDRQFAEFKKTNDYKKLVQQIKKEGGNWDEKATDSFIRSFVTNYTSKILVN